MSAHVVVLEIVGIVGDDERNAGVASQTIDQGHNDLVLIEMMILHLEEEVVLAEEVLIFVREATGLFIAIGDSEFR